MSVVVYSACNCLSKTIQKSDRTVTDKVLNKHRTVTSQLLLACFRYDPSTDRWQYICNLPSPRQLCTGGLMGNKIYIIGGIFKDKLTKTAFIFDTKSDSFIEVRHTLHNFHGPKDFYSFLFQNRRIVLLQNAKTRIQPV